MSSTCPVPPIIPPPPTGDLGWAPVLKALLLIGSTGKDLKEDKSNQGRKMITHRN